MQDFVFHYPRRYEDRSHFDRLQDGNSTAPLCLCGTVIGANRKFFGRGKSWFEIQLEQSSDGIFCDRWTCRWFNSAYLHKVFAVGDKVVVYGKTKASKSRTIVMDHPEFEILDEDRETSVHFGRITPVYPLSEGITAKFFRETLHRTLEELDLEKIPSLVPSAQSPMPFARALKAVHFPTSMEELAAARPALSFEEFFGVQAILVSRRKAVNNLPGVAKDAPGKLVARLRERLPFALTGDQEKVLKEIFADLASPKPMQRLLQGDVGSGKTIVALAAALLAIESGHQAVFMAPTQILAEQHQKTFLDLLTPLGISVHLYTGGKKQIPANDDTPSLFADGSLPPLIVGTHALLYDSAPLGNPGIIIIDEQHKFGVMQRARLMKRGTAPDLLVMTATPIPRTISQTLHGDLDVSILREKPANRGVVKTAVRMESKLPEITRFLRQEIESGRQVFIVYPLIEESEALSAKAATAEFSKWREALFPAAVALLHGRMSNEEKEAVMEDFRAGRTGALVSTTVIEVGVDIPNASIMLVENAERFGLAQLHQLRGRIGRGIHKSYCILVVSAKNPEAMEKLSILEKTNDGFEIAEADLVLRGPGDLVGTAQSGLPPLRIGDLVREGDLMSKARALALKTFAEDPSLDAPQNRALKEFLQNKERQMAAAAG